MPKFPLLLLALLGLVTLAAELVDNLTVFGVANILALAVGLHACQQFRWCLDLVYRVSRRLILSRHR